MTIPIDVPADPKLTPAQVRQLCRDNKLPTIGTQGYAPAHAQANLLILPAKYADTFRTFCRRNPVPCPIIGELAPGNPIVPEHLAKNCDIRTDIGKYYVYKNGERVEERKDIKDLWTDDMVAFLIGCSYSFEGALLEGGIKLRHHELGRIVPTYRSSTPLMRAGPFGGRMVVSMRPFKPDQIPLLQEICRPYSGAHGEPVAWGAEGAKDLGITDVQGQNPEWGQPTVMEPGEIPVYWGCGVTPQQVALDAKLPETITSHKAGYMLVLDMLRSGTCE